MAESLPQTSRMPGQDRRRQLIETALDLFARKGFEGTTTKEIATAAGVTESVIFRHFPSKHALYMAVLDFKVQSIGLEDWLKETQSCMDRNDDAGLVRAIISGILRDFRSDPRYERVKLFAALEGHEVGLAHYRQFAIPIFQLLRDYLARRQREGALRDCNPTAIMAAVSGMAQNYAVLTSMFGFGSPDLSDEQVIEIFTAIIMNGIQKT
ncbi:MAG: TetR/AcrR family transcriptional regulator [Bryobacteraceae bacterium]|jgi:TetR/AcrR family transcriptional regulator